MIQLRKKKLFGLDVGSYSIKLVELKEGKKGYQLINIGLAPVPPDAIVDGALMDPGAIADAISDLLASSKIKLKDISTSIAGHSVIIKKITLASMSEEELADSIQWEAEQYVPFDIADVNLDFEILGPDPVDESQMEVLLVAAKKETIDDYTAVFKEAGLNPIVMDIDAFACQNMHELNHPPEEGKVTAIVNIGAGLTNVNIIKEGISLFVRDVASGGNQFTEEIQKTFGVGQEVADSAKLGATVEGVDPSELKEVMRESMDGIASEIARTLDFFLATNPDDSVDEVFVSGGGARVAGLGPLMSEKLGVPVEIVSPFQVISHNKKFAEIIDKEGPSFGVAVGLAIRKAVE